MMPKRSATRPMSNTAEPEAGHEKHIGKRGQAAPYLELLSHRLQRHDGREHGRATQGHEQQRHRQAHQTDRPDLAGRGGSLFSVFTAARKFAAPLSRPSGDRMGGRGEKLKGNRPLGQVKDSLGLSYKGQADEAAALFTRRSR